MLPQTDFITAMFNAHPDDIEILETFKLDTIFHYHIKANCNMKSSTQIK